MAVRKDWSQIICPRTACADLPTHKVSEHLDPRSERYDGPETGWNALPGDAKRAAYALRAAGAPVPEIVTLTEEIHRLRDQVAAVQVDADRRERAAMARAESCALHGALIAEAGKQIHAISEQHRRADNARVVLVNAMHEIERSAETKMAGSRSADDPWRKLRDYVADALRRHSAKWRS